MTAYVPPTIADPHMAAILRDYNVNPRLGACVPRVGALLRLVLCPRGPTCVARHARLHIGWRGCAHVRVASVVWCCHLGCTEYRTISAVNGPLVVLDNVKVRRPACVRMQ